MSDYNIDEERNKIKLASQFIQQMLSEHRLDHPEFKDPSVLIICGSGLGGIATRVAESNPTPLTIRYENIPGFKTSTVAGHSGVLTFGEMAGTPVVLMNGRLHTYEGYAIWDTVFPLRVLNELQSVKTLIVTNAAGGINRGFNVCDLMCINDHINFPGLAGLHPLKGPNFEETGPRFLPLSDAYDLELRKLLFKKRKELNITRGVHEGVYTYVSGPTFETRAENRMIKAIGGDAVGMSTVPEVIIARHCGWRVLALSLITNVSVLDPPASAEDENPIPLEHGMASHAEVLENGKIASLDVERLVEAVVHDL